jgi:hypothetical protein
MLASDSDSNSNDIEVDGTSTNGTSNSKAKVDVVDGTSDSEAEVEVECDDVDPGYDRTYHDEYSFFCRMFPHDMQVTATATVAQEFAEAPERAKKT